MTPSLSLLLKYAGNFRQIFFIHLAITATTRLVADVTDVFHSTLLLCLRSISLTHGPLLNLLLLLYQNLSKA